MSRLGINNSGRLGVGNRRENIYWRRDGWWMLEIRFDEGRMKFLGERKVKDLGELWRLGAETNEFSWREFWKGGSV